MLIPIVRPSHCLCTRISNSASPRRAVYKRPSPMAPCEIFHFVQNDKSVQNDKARARGHRFWNINTQRGRFVAVSSGKSKLRSSIVEDNVQKTSFSYSSVRLGVGARTTVSDALSEHGIQYVLTHPTLGTG